MIHIDIGLLIILITILFIIFENWLPVNKDQGLKILFILLILTVISIILSYFIHTPVLITIGSLLMYLAFAFGILHSSKVLGNKKTLLFFLLAGSIGLIDETLGVIYLNYHYTGSGLLFGLVPLLIPLSWALFIYVSYTITNMLLFGFGGEKPRYQNKLFSLLGLLIVLSAIDGLIAMNFDMIMDPIAVSPLVNGWIWTYGGPYFGIPLLNFEGWFIVTFISTITFRFYEAFSSKKENPLSKIGWYAYAPALYLLFLLQQSVYAIGINHPEYILIGVATMMPFILLPLLLLVIRKHKNVITS